MRQIRRQAFETNSSSTHAICISKEPVTDINFPSSFDFTHGEFGWEQNVYTSPTAKGAYLNEAINSLPDDQAAEYRKKLIKIFKDHNIQPDFANNNYNIFDGDMYYDSGYIDHSEYLPDILEEIFKSEDEVLSFLFNDKSMVITGNDNDGQDLIEATLYGGDEENYFNNKLDQKMKNYRIYWKGN